MKTEFATEGMTSMQDTQYTEVQWEPFNDGGSWAAVHVTTEGRQWEVDTAGALHTRINVEKGEGPAKAVYGTQFDDVYVADIGDVTFGQVSVCDNGGVWMLGTGGHEGIYEGAAFYSRYDDPNEL
jgi:hypothetical protein